MNAVIERTREEILEKMSQIEDKCYGWKKCQDGSYEMALESNGYYELVKELKTK